MKIKRYIGLVLLAFFAVFVLTNCKNNEAGTDQPISAEINEETEKDINTPTAGPSPGTVNTASPTPSPSPGASNQPETAPSPVGTGAGETSPAPAPEQEGAEPSPASTPVPESSAAAESSPSPVNPQDAVITDNPLTCTLSVVCHTALDNIDQLKEEKRDIVPADGIIFPAAEVTFFEGESAFNLLQREMKKNKIHLEFVNPPGYHSAYIEGIGNLYQFDCGELSGWVYRVNDWFPDYGSGRYQLKEGDVVEFVYSCDLGRDVGGRNGEGGE